MMNLIIGMVIGAVFGLFVMALMSTSGNLSRCEECFYKKMVKKGKYDENRHNVL